MRPGADAGALGLHPVLHLELKPSRPHAGVTVFSTASTTPGWAWGKGRREALGSKGARAQPGAALP